MGPELLLFRFWQHHDRVSQDPVIAFSHHPWARFAKVSASVYIGVSQMPPIGFPEAA